MALLGDARMYARFAFGLRGYLRGRLTPGEAERIIAERLANRETNLLRLIERGIYGHPASPYQRLLRLARIDVQDIRALVTARGVEGALGALKDAGVFVEFEAFKGIKPIVRDGQVIDVAPHDFDNPHARHHYEARSGGSTRGIGTRVMYDLDNVASWTPGYRVGLQALGAAGAPAVFWRPILPASAGMSGVLLWARLGIPVLKWFTPVAGAEVESAMKFKAATHLIIAMSNAFGARLPFPEVVPLDEAARVARFVAETRDRYGACLFRASVSMALRACLAASAEGLDFTNVTVLGGGEAPTPAKIAGITRTGARFAPTYVFSEGGPVGWGCPNARGNDVHFFDDMLALVQSPRVVPGTDVTVDTFHFTTLMPTAPKLLLNVEIDDFGRVERRPCGCPLEACGLTTHLSGIQSFSKLNGEGMTLVGTHMVEILEQVLPSRFGGSALDYQLVEEEDERGLTRLTLIVAPQVDLPDEQEPIRVLLAALTAGGAAGALASGVWAQASTLRVRRGEPHVSSAGKQMSLRVLRRMSP